MTKRFKVSSIVLGLLCLMYFLSYIDRANMATASFAIKDELGLSNTQLGLIFSAFAYPYAIFQISGGWVADRFGARRTLFLCIFVAGFATVLTGLAGGVISLFAARLLLGAGEGAAFPTATRALQDWLPATKRGYAQGLTHAFSRFGNSLTPPLVAILIAATSWRGSFIVLGFATMIWVVAWLWYFRDDPRTHPGMTPAQLAELPPAISRKESAKAPVGPLARRLAPGALVYFCYGWSLWMFLNWLPSFFKEGYQLDLKNSALMASGVFFAGVLGDLVGGVLSDAIYRRTGRLAFSRLSVIIGSMLGSAAALTAMFFVRDINAIALLLSLGFFFLEMVIGPIWAVPMDIAPKYSGTASGFMCAGSAIAGIISPIVFGIVVDVTGNWTLPFVASIVLLIAGAGLALTIHPERPFVETPEDVAPDLAVAAAAEP